VGDKDGNSVGKRVGDSVGENADNVDE